MRNGFRVLVGCFAVAMMGGGQLAGPALAAPAAAEAKAADPVAIVKSLYAEGAEPFKATVYSRRLKALFDADAKRANGEVGNLDFDFTIAGQDTEDGFRRSLRFAPAKISGDKADVTVTFNNGGSQELVYSCIRQNGGWVIDDVVAKGKEGWRLSTILKGTD